MGRTRLYASNAERQRHFQQVKKEKELQQKIEVAQKTNITQVNQKIENFESLVNRWFYGKTLQQVNEAYEHYKQLYKVIGVDVDFQPIRTYLEEEHPLIHSITIGRIQQFLEIGDPHIECPICGYWRSGLETKGCPECHLKITAYQNWKEFRSRYP